MFPEETLIRLVRERHPLGAEALYAMYSASLYGVVSRIIPDTGLSEDVLQDSFIRIWLGFDQYDPFKGRLFTWMVNIARHLAIDQIRSKSYRNRQRHDELSACDHLAAAEHGYTRIDQVMIRTGVGLLPEAERSVIDLIYFGGFTHIETAEQLRLPLGTVKTRLTRAVRKLRHYYTSECLPLAS